MIYAKVQSKSLNGGSRSIFYHIVLYMYTSFSVICMLYFCTACINKLRMKLSNFPVSADVFKKEIWVELDEIQDPELRELGSFLPGVVIRSRTPATVEKYAGAFCRWKK